MIDFEKRQQIIALVKREVVPAIGCTEPIAVALCVARATEVLLSPLPTSPRGGEDLNASADNSNEQNTSNISSPRGGREGALPDSIDVHLSGNMLKNAMGVGIPGTGMAGLPIAIALGAIIGKSEYQLEVLKDVTPEAVEKGKEYIAENRISVALKEGDCDKLYIEVVAKHGSDTAHTIIAGDHTHFILIEKNGEDLLNGKNISKNLSPSGESEGGFGGCGGSCSLTLRTVYDFATTAPLSEIEFINEARKLNESAAKQSLLGNYGHELGKTLSRPLGRGIMGDSMFSHILSATSSACDARMAGAMIPVMSNSGSGNQGIAATMPVVVFGEENHNTEEEITRGLMLSHLTAIYIKQSLGKLSALCGCVVASTGSSCGITYLMGGTYEQVAFSVKNMIANLAGMVCDGAKPSCALKVSSGVSTAVLSAMLAIQNKHVTSVEGLIEDDVDRTIHNMTRIGSEGMNETDKMVLDIMTHKKAPQTPKKAPQTPKKAPQPPKGEF